MQQADERGQATVELALCLPLLALLLGAVVEIALIAVDEVRVWHAAREAVRAAAVDPDPRAAKLAARSSGLAGVDVLVSPEPRERSPDEDVTATIDYLHEPRVPLVGLLFRRVRLHAEATMRIEQP